MGKIMWFIIFGVAILLGIGSVLYLSHKIGRYGLLTVIAAVLLCVLILDLNNTIIIVVHFTCFLLIGDLISLAVKIISGRIISRYTDIAAASLCVICLVIGWILMHGLWETDYDLTTEKDAGTIRIAHIADSHIGTGFSGRGFAEKLERIEASSPDILVITGDFVDDSTKKEDMEEACRALGDFATKYGVFFCFGNHDRGYFSNERRGYSGDDLIAELEKNKVTVLEDESVLIDDRFYVIGRCDAGYGRSDRKSMEDLVRDLDKDKYMIVLDHQPTDYDNEAAAGVDLVLSGHTHGGQLWPLEYIQPLISQNDNVRGLKRLGNTDFIVTDGISDWAILFRTGCRSEFGLITVKKVTTSKEKQEMKTGHNEQ